MDSFKGSAEFCYNPSAEDHSRQEEDGFPGLLLDVYIHHARNIHNICIYANQDVYAKFSLTCSPDETVSTRIVNGGGKNPQFEERLKIKVSQPESVLKCEIWMLSRARNYLEDQLLGFTLVPLSLVAMAKGQLTQDFTLSSTDLFHSPAGTVKLTLSLDTSFSCIPPNNTFVKSTLSSISSEVVILNPAEYETIEFPDISIVRENQQMVSEYFDMALNKSARPVEMRESRIPFLHLGTSPQSVEDYDMTAYSSEGNSGSLDSSDGGIHNSGLFSNSTAASLGDDKATAESVGKMIQVPCDSNIKSQSSAASPDTPTSKNGVGIEERNDSKVSNKEDPKTAAEASTTGAGVQPGSGFTSSLGTINLDAEQSAMQQQIVDMYMKSVQHFTESLANMKLPMDIDKPRTMDGKDAVQSQRNNLDIKKKDGSRVFYGSRAFF